MATSVRVLGSFSSGFDWDLHWLRLCVCVYTVTHFHTNISICLYIYTFRYIHRCCPGIQVVHRCLYLLSGWFPKYVDQSGAPNQQGLFRGLAVTWRQAHVLAEAQTLLTAARHGLAMILWTRSVWNSVLTWSCCEISELLYGGDLLKVGKQLESTYFGVWWTTRVWLQYFHIFSRWGSGKSMFRFI